MDVPTLHSWLRASHIVAGFLGLVAFWMTLLAKKGGGVHLLCGRIFVICATVVISTSLIVCGWGLIDPLGLFRPENRPSAADAAEVVNKVRFFGALLGAATVYTLIPLVLGVRVVQTRREPHRLAGLGIKLLLWSQVAVSAALVAYASVHLSRDISDALYAMLLAVGIGGLGASWWDLRFVAKPRFSPMFWWYKHMEFMLRTGIAFHTAFFIFGAKPWLGSLGSGPWALVPWVLPSAVGVPAAWLWIQHYRRKFGDVIPAPLADAEGTDSPSVTPIR